VVREPQNPRAIKREYLPSRFHYSEIITKIPRMKAPRVLTINTFRGIVLNIRGDPLILNLKKAPNTEPTARNTNSSPFNYIHKFFLLVLLMVLVFG